MNPQDLCPALTIRQGHGNQSVEPSGTGQCRINRVDPVCRPHDDHAMHVLQTIQVDQQCAHYSVSRFVRIIADRRDRVEFIKEQDRRHVRACVIKDCLEPTFRLAVPLRCDVGTPHVHESRASTGC